jgi:hypothetical protein
MLSGAKASTESTPEERKNMYQGSPRPTTQIGSRGGAIAIFLDEHHQEAEAHQQHRENVDGEVVLLNLSQSPLHCAFRRPGRTRGREPGRGSQSQNADFPFQHVSPHGIGQPIRVPDFILT